MSHYLDICKQLRTRPRGYITVFMLNSAEQEIQMLIKTKIPTNEELSSFKPLRYCFYHGNKC